MVRPAPSREVWALAMPKSQTFTKSGSPRREASMMLLGLRSRWTMPWACASSSAPSTWSMMRPTRASDSGPSRRMSWPEVHPLQQLHGDVEQVLIAAEVDDLDRVGVVQAGGVPGLELEALEQPLVAHELAAQELEGHHLAQRHLLGLVDVPHGAGADQLEHPEVGPDDPADDGGRRPLEALAGPASPGSPSGSLCPDRPAPPAPYRCSGSFSSLACAISLPKPFAMTCCPARRYRARRVNVRARGTFPGTVHFCPLRRP